MSEKCVRCRSAGADRRTLRHACFYEMSELPVPFEEQVVLVPPTDGQMQITKRPGVLPGTGIVITSGRVRTDAELTVLKLYTLRVCKRCRGDWLDAIRRWFDEGRNLPMDDDADA